MPNRERKQLRNKHSPNENVANNRSPSHNNNKPRFDFSYTQWIKCTVYKDYTNMVCNDTQFAKSIVTVFNVIIPEVTRNWDQVKLNGVIKHFEHCHTIREEKLSLVQAISESIHGKQILDNDDNHMNYWQFGMKQSTRLIAILDADACIIYPLFIDHNHLIYPSVKHNQNDFANYNWCPCTMYT